MLSKANSRRFIAVPKDTEVSNGELDKLKLKLRERMQTKTNSQLVWTSLYIHHHPRRHPHQQHNRAHVSKKNKSFHYSVLFQANSIETWKSKRISQIFCAWLWAFAERISWKNFVFELNGKLKTEKLVTQFSWNCCSIFSLLRLPSVIIETFSYTKAVAVIFGI